MIQWGFLIALALAIPVIGFPVAFVWHMNLNDIFFHAKGATRKQEVAHEKAVREVVSKTR